MKQIINVENLQKAGPYSHAVKGKDLIFLSGQTGDGANFTEQFKNAMEKIKAVLKTSGNNLDHVLKVTVYISDRSFFKEMNSAYSEYFKSDYPARTTVVASFPNPNTLVEIDIIAEQD